MALGLRLGPAARGERHTQWAEKKTPDRLIREDWSAIYSLVPIS